MQVLSEERKKERKKKQHSALFSEFTAQSPHFLSNLNQFIMCASKGRLLHISVKPGIAHLKKVKKQTKT